MLAASAPLDAMEHHSPQGAVSASSDRRIGVMHLIHTMAYGGVETALLNWILNMNRSRFDVHLVCFANPGETERPFVKAAEERGLTVHRIPWGRRKPILLAARRTRDLIRRLEIDILHTHNWYADYVGALTARLISVKTVTTLYVWSHFDWKRNLLQAIDRFVIRYYDRITAHCQDTWRKTVAMGFAAERVGLLICGYQVNAVHLAPEERLRRRRAMGVADDEILLANVARFYPEKAQDALLRCFKRISERQPKARLWMLGVGPLEEELKQLCTRLGLDEKVTWLGFASDLHEKLPLFDIQLHPSHMEGVPLAILSGMATGLPIVASNVGGLQEVLRHEQNGVLVPAGDEDAFVKQTLRLMQNPDEARRLGEAARRFIEQDYSIETAVRRVESTYEEVLGRCALASSS